MTMYEDKVKEFITAFGQPVNANPLDEDLMDFRFDLIMEEFNEFYDAWYEFTTCPTRDNKVEMLKELVDLQYVLSGFVVTFGLPFEEAFKRVHESNMSKLGADGAPVYREDGKVLKGEFYQPPVLEDLCT